MTEHFDELETRSAGQRARDLVEALGAQLAHAKSNVPAYADALSDMDCGGFSSLDDLSAYPVTRKSALIEQQEKSPPFGGLSAIPDGEIKHIFASPGPIYEASSHRPDFWRMARTLYAAGFRAGDLVHNSFSYHMTPAGMMLDSGLHALGCAVIPAGVGQTELQVQAMAELHPSGYAGTPSFLKIMLEKADELGLDITSLKRGMVSGEALPPPLRSIFSDRDIQVLQAYATADLGVIAYETIPDDGLVVDEGVYVEIVRPGSGDPVPEGEVGEVLVTNLNPDYPLIRFATGDMSAFLAGVSECGRTNKRIKGWMGRADQTVKVRGMFIHPEQVHGVVTRHPEILKARLIVDWIDQQDEMTLQCEISSETEGLADSIAETIRDFCKVRGDVKLVSPGSIANDGVVIEDVRKYE